MLTVMMQAPNNRQDTHLEDFTVSNKTTLMISYSFLCFIPFLKHVK